MKKLLIAVVTLLVCACLWLALQVQTMRPNYEFTLPAAEVSEAVEVIFDDMAVPHIYAASESDALFALGYVQASERLWQMDLLRRAGAGALSALLGEDMVENDKYLRTLGMRRTAIEQSVKFHRDAPDSIRTVLQAYLDGVNAFIAEGNFPLEYRLVGADPEPFTTEDVYCAAGFMAYSFAIHLKTEPILDWMKHHLDSSYYALLAVDQKGFTRIPNRGPTPRDVTCLSARVERLDGIRPVPQWLGSNAWVLSGERTASGQVIFCNDAHMSYAQPSVWYEAHIVTPQLEYYGNHLAGIPFPAIGHTRDHAWGITMFVNDDIDLYREQIEGDRYRFGDEWRPLERRAEVIEVAGGEAVEFEVLSTHHGPLIEEDIAMWWTYTQYPENRIPEAFYGFSRSKGIEAFEDHAALVHAPGVNMMYGDSEGNIGWWASAKLPMRPEHVDTKTAIDGTDPTNDPNGWYPFEMNPQTVNPERGFVYSANNAPEPRDSMRYVGHFYAGNTRAAGIFAALSMPRNDWTIEEAQQLQLNGYSPVYRENLKRMVAYAQSAGVDVEDFLLGWDGRHEVNDIAPTLYYRWMYRVIEGAMADEFEQLAQDGSGREKFVTWHKTIVSENTFPRLLAAPESPWWDDASTDDLESPAQIVVRALERARQDLTEALGSDSDDWEYGKLHTVTHHHAMKDVPVLGGLFDVGPFPVPAAKDALNKYEFKIQEALDYSVFSGPSMRISLDFAEVARSESVLPTGQSGNVFSPYYDNQALLYHAGAFRLQRMDLEDIVAHEIARASIVPVP